MIMMMMMIRILTRAYRRAFAIISREYLDICTSRYLPLSLSHSRLHHNSRDAMLLLTNISRGVDPLNIIEWSH